MSDEAIGKTVARVEFGPTDPEYGHKRDDTVLIHFTDGTALSVQGSSYEEVSQDAELIDGAQVKRLAAAAAGRRERERIRDLQRAEYAALPAEEKAKREAVRRAKMSPMARMMEDELRGAARSMVADMNRQSFSTPAHQQRGKARRS